jgi:hypothetical protein
MADPWVAATCVVAASLIWWRRDKALLVAVSFLCILLGFVAVKSVTRVRAHALFMSRVTGVPPTRIVPVWGSMTQWEVYGREDNSIAAWLVDLGRGSVDLQMKVREHRGGPAAIAIAASLDWTTVRNFRRTHDLAFAIASPADAAVTRVVWSDLRYCGRLPGADAPEQIACAVSAGGEITSPGAPPRLIVTIGRVVQTR